MYLKGKMSGLKVGSQFKIEFEVKSKIKEHIMLALCQTYSQEFFLTKLIISKSKQQSEKYNSKAYALQQVYDLFLDTGKYTAIFEVLTEIKKSPDVCARIFYSKSNENSVNIYYS